MILYLDTSSLVKLYLDEIHAEAVRQWAGQAEVLATSKVAYPEAMAALSRRFREGDMDQEGFHRVIAALEREWPDFAAIDIDEIEAGNMAVKHALRGLDAIHLAAALTIHEAEGSIQLRFSSFDRHLNKAATKEGFQVLDENAI